MSLKLADKITLTIHDIAFGGEGVGRMDEFVVFVPFVLVGEMVEVEITEVKKNFARAKLLRVVTPSPDRVDAGMPLLRRNAAAASISTLITRRSCASSTSRSRICSSASGKFRATVVAPVIPCPSLTAIATAS